MARGYRALKFDPFGPGGREIGRDERKRAAKQVEAVRRAIGDEPDILLEFHGRFSPIMALEAMRAMVPYSPTWCEERVPAHNNEAMARWWPRPRSASQQGNTFTRALDFSTFYNERPHTWSSRISFIAAAF